VAEILSKSAYARATGVNPAAVSNWIRRGQLTGPAVRRDGKINRELADQQLAITIQSPAGSAAHRLQPISQPQPASSGDGPAWTPGGQASLQLLRAKALSASVDAERKRRELNHERGKYTLTAEARSEFAKVLSDFLLGVEQSLGDLVDTLQLDMAGATELRRWWRNQRAQAARATRAKAEAAPQFADDAGIAA
jgi:hypothetical protein